MNRTAQGDATTDATLSLPLLLHGALQHSTCTQTWKQEMFALKRRIHHCNCAHSKTSKKLKDQCHRRAHLSMSASSALVKSASCHCISKNCKFMQLPQAAFMPPYRLGCCCMGHTHQMLALGRDVLMVSANCRTRVHLHKRAGTIDSNVHRLHTNASQAARVAPVATGRVAGIFHDQHLHLHKPCTRQRDRRCCRTLRNIQVAAMSSQSKANSLRLCQTLPDYAFMVN
jgi:hypothetical protein